MEYKVNEQSGKVVWYNLVGGDGIPKKGRCSPNQVLLIDGIVVVPDSDSARKVPSFPGLLTYRKDNKKLYVHEFERNMERYRRGENGYRNSH